MSRDTRRLPPNTPATFLLSGCSPVKRADPCLEKAPKSLPNVPNTPEEKGGKKSVCDQVSRTGISKHGLPRAGVRTPSSMEQKPGRKPGGAMVNPSEVAAP